MKNTYLLAAVLALIPVEAGAISRLSSERMSCVDVQAAIRNEGAVILRYASKRVPGLPLYDRYVAHGGYCGVGEFAKLVTVPTRDTPSCRVYKCQQETYDDRFIFR